jgi:hypothetical protein
VSRLAEIPCWDLVSKGKLFGWKNRETFYHFIWEDIAAVVLVKYLMEKQLEKEFKTTRATGTRIGEIE